jgi:divalent metal cation (Fe/Co/Zn/Cd) transporter
MELNQTARLLAWATVGYNTAEGLVAILAGLGAGSVALVSFGLDSAVEVLSALAVSWQFAGRGNPQKRERRALRLIALSFFALAGYVAFDAVRGLLRADHPAPSPVGIGLAVVSLLVMPALSWAKRGVGRELGSLSVVADASQTALCSYLSAVLLAG